MTYEEYKSLKVGGLCVIIKTGEPGRVLEINRNTQDVRLVARRTGLGIVKEWFNYTHIAKL